MSLSSISGARILVTRPAHQAGRLCRLIEQQGGLAIRFPVLRIVPTQDSFTLANKLNPYDWVIFTSPNAVNFALKANNGKIALQKNVHFASIGPATADTLKKAGIMIDLVPDSSHNSEALLACTELRQVKGLSFLIVRGCGGRELLAETLRSRGANVHYLEVYKRVLPTVNTEPVTTMLENAQLDIITITSVEALYNLLALLGEKIKKQLLSVPLIVISERIKKTAEELGFNRIAVSEKPSDTAIIRTVTALMNGEDKWPN